MRNVSSAFIRALANDRRNYENRFVITLANGIVLNVDNTRIWEGGVSIEDSVSADNTFQVGAAIINQGTFIINNIYGEYDKFSFDGAKVVVYLALNNLDDGTDEEIKLGTFVTDEVTYNGSIITLVCHDNMSKFDKAYDTTLTYPNTLEQIVLDACSKCGVTLANSSLNFPHKSYIVTTKPSKDNTTYRQVISWAAQIACCFARCNSDGQLEFKWYDTSFLNNVKEWLDGGIFDDGAVPEWLSGFMNTENDMTALSSAYADDSWFYVQNSIGFKFNGTVYDNLYISSNSGFTFANTQPSGSSTSANKNVNICCRDGSSVSIKYQEISEANRKAIKVRFQGYTRYGTGNMVPAYALTYEIFFIDNGLIVVNVITLPTNTSYLGTTSVIENSVTSTFSPTTDNVIMLTRDASATGAWIADATSPYYVTGDTADGGSFEPWDTGYVADGGSFTDRGDFHSINSSYSSTISTDDVVITGVKVIKKIKGDNTADTYLEYLCGTSGYVIVVENNDFIDGTHGQDVADWIGGVLVGVAFRKADLSHPNDPTMEAGDVALYTDRRGNRYPIIISSTRFTVGDSQRTVSSAATPARNSSQRFSEAARSYVEMHQDLINQKEELETAWETAEAELSERIDNASGLYCTQVTQSGSVITYYHDKSTLAESNIVMMFSDVGFTMTSNYQDTTPTWYGMTVDGTMIAAILNTVGVNADWINTGALVIKDSSNREIFYANVATGVIRMHAWNSSGAEKFSLDSSSGALSLRGSLTLGGASNANGSLSILDSSNSQIGTWDNSGINITKGSLNIGNDNFKVTSGGALSAKSATITGGSLNIGNGNFEVTSGGALSAKSASISGTVSSTGDSVQFIGIPTIEIKKADIRFTATQAYGFAAVHAFSGLNDYIGLQITAPDQISMGNSVDQKGVYVYGPLSVTGTKSRIVEDTSFGDRLLYAYETTTPYFGDIGTGRTNENGESVISIDGIFNETVNTDVEYSVFLQKEGRGDIWVDEKEHDYFVVKGTPNLRFSWELKVVQRGCEHLRTEDYVIASFDRSQYQNIGLDLTEDIENADSEILFDDAWLNEDIVFEDII